MITQKARYAFKALIVLASQAGKTVRIDAIAKEGEIPRKFLERILLDLKRRGLIESRRGRAGGYVLLKPAAAITLGDVLRMIDGPIAPLTCISRTAYRRCADCRDETNCALRRLFSAAYSATLQVMDATTLADGLAPSARENGVPVEDRPSAAPKADSAEGFFTPDRAKENQLR